MYLFSPDSLAASLNEAHENLNYSIPAWSLQTELSQAQTPAYFPNFFSPPREIYREEIIVTTNSLNETEIRLKNCFIIISEKETVITTKVNAIKHIPTAEDKKLLASNIPNTTQILYLENFHRGWLEIISIPNTVREIYLIKSSAYCETILKERLQILGHPNIPITCRGGVYDSVREEPEQLPSKMKKIKSWMTQIKEENIQTMRLNTDEGAKLVKATHRRSYKRSKREVSNVSRISPNF